MPVQKYFVLLSASIWVCSGCITSGPGQYGPTPDAIELELTACPDGLLDDLEDGDNQVAKLNGRDGYWYTFQDEAGSTITPKGDFASTPGGPVGFPGIPDSKLTATMRGKIAPVGESLYVGMGMNFKNPKSLYDVSPAVGISFWGKGPGRVRMEVMDVNTSPEGDRCEKCYNHFGVELYLSKDWLRYTVPFAKLTQQPGWGDRAPELTRTAVYGVQWLFKTANTEYEISIDDVVLVGCEGGR